MFNNIGGKIKALAKVICWVIIICGSIAGIVAATQSRGAYGIVVAAVSIIMSVLFGWISTMMLYGMGEIIDNTSKMVDLLSRKNDSQSNLNGF